jgi:hypothetical protein
MRFYPSSTRTGLISAAAALAIAGAGTSPAWAAAVFHSCETTQITPTTLRVTAVESGLASGSTLNFEVTATAQCVNPGTNKPKASNKQDLSGTGSVPVGKTGTATIVQTLTADLNCSPPMTIEFTDVVVTDLDNGVSVSCPCSGVSDCRNP